MEARFFSEPGVNFMLENCNLFRALSSCFYSFSRVFFSPSLLFFLRNAYARRAAARKGECYPRRARVSDFSRTRRAKLVSNESAENEFRRREKLILAGRNHGFFLLHHRDLITLTQPRLRVIFRVNQDTPGRLITRFSSNSRLKGRAKS